MATSSSPCGACKFLRRKCAPECIFAPYFPPDQPLKFANAHKIFGASNIAKILNELHPHQRAAAVNSLAYEAEARIKDPVYGCVGAISILKRHIELLEHELRVARAELARYMGIGLQGTSINLQTGPSDHLMGNDQAAMIAASVRLGNEPNLGPRPHEQIWLLGNEQPIYEAEFIGNMEAMQLARASQTFRPRMDAPMDGRSTSSGEGAASNISTISSP